LRFGAEMVSKVWSFDGGFNGGGEREKKQRENEGEKLLNSFG